MTLTQNLILSGATALSVLMMTALNADTNGLVFPPANALGGANNSGNGVISSPQRPSQPMMNRMPQVPNYNFVRQNPQQQMRFPPTANQFRPVAPSNGAYRPQTRPMQGGVMSRAMPKNMPTPMQRAMPQSAPRQAYPIQRNRPQQQYPSYPQRNRSNNSFPFSNNMMPFGTSGSNNSFPFSNGNMPFSNGSMPFNNNGNSFGMPSNPMNNMLGNRNGSMPFFNQSNKKRKKAWGNDRNIWPDFYTDFTDEGWDTMMSGPRDLGTMPGGWRFPYLSTPDPVTVTDAIVNQFPPIAEEAGNMADFSDWGVFDNK